MTREILPSNSETTQKPGAGADSKQPAAPAAHAHAKDKDALAGAFPDWDLVPASPFVRRVK